MNAHQTQKFAMLSRVVNFGQKNAGAFPAETIAASLFGSLETVLETLTSHAVTKAAGNGLAREGSANRRLARKVLREDMEAIGRTARAIAIDRPNIEQKFRLPASMRDQAILDSARAFAAEAVPLAAEFELLALDAAFFRKLDADIAAFEQALAGQRDGRDRRVAAASAIDDVLGEGVRLVRKLDSYVRNRFADDPLTLGAWLSASRIRRTSRGRSRDEEPSPADEPPAAA